MEATTTLNMPGPTGAQTSAARILAGLAAAVGGFLIASSIFGMLAYLIVPLARPSNALADNVTLASAAAIGLVFGFIILAVAIAVLRGTPLPRFILPSPLVFVAIFFLVIGFGQAILFVNVGAAYLFPPWHVLASLMLPLAALAYGARRLAPAPGQSVLAEFAWGGAATVLLALVFELVVGVILLAGVALLLAVLIGPDRLTQLFEQLRSISSGTPDPERIFGLLRAQPLALVLVILAAVMFFSVIGPLIEESLKGLGPGIWIVRTKPPAGRALLWGLAAGAGFAFSENLLMGANLVNGGGGTGQLWWLPMLLRGGTSLVHVGATATVSLGWYSAFVERKRASALLFFLAGFAAHGSWNLLTIVVSSAISGAGLLQASASGFPIGAVLLAALAVTVFVLLVLAAALWIAWLIRWAKGRDYAGGTEPI